MGDPVSKLQKLYLREITIGETYFGSGLVSAGFPSTPGKGNDCGLISGIFVTLVP